jgi:hypothetical protein
MVKVFVRVDGARRFARKKKAGRKKAHLKLSQSERVVDGWKDSVGRRGLSSTAAGKEKAEG